MALNSRVPTLFLCVAGLFLTVLAFHAGATTNHDPKLKSSSVLIIDQKPE